MGVTPTKQRVKDRIRASHEAGRELAIQETQRQDEEIARWEWHLPGYLFVGSRPLKKGERFNLALHLAITHLLQIVLFYTAYLLVAPPIQAGFSISLVVFLVCFGLMAPAVYLQHHYARAYRKALKMGRALRFVSEDRREAHRLKGNPASLPQIVGKFLSADNRDRRFLDLAGTDGFVLRSDQKWAIDFVLVEKGPPARVAPRGSDLELTSLEIEEVKARYEDLKSRSWVTAAITPFALAFALLFLGSFFGSIAFILNPKHYIGLAQKPFKDFRLMLKLRKDRHATHLIREGKSLYLPSGTLWSNGEGPAKWRIDESANP